jgi:hypothetical protein
VKEVEKAVAAHLRSPPFDARPDSVFASAVAERAFTEARDNLRSAMRLTAALLAQAGGEVRLKPEHIQSIHPGDRIETRIDLVTQEMVVTLVRVRPS